MYHPSSHPLRRLAALALLGGALLLGPTGGQAAPHASATLEQDCALVGHLVEQVAVARDLGMPLTTVLQVLRARPASEAFQESIRGLIYRVYGSRTGTPATLRQDIEWQCLGLHPASPPPALRTFRR